MGAFQQAYFSSGIPKEAELVCRKGIWYFNLVLEIPEPISEITNSSILGIDIGENVLAAASSGKILGGKQVRHEREVYLAKRRQLQSNGTQSSKQLLKKISGREARRIKHINHNVSKQIVKEAIAQNVSMIAMEDLTHIRQSIKAGKRIKGRLHRWGFRQLQTMIQYKAESAGLAIAYVNPAYSSQTCSVCDFLGVRKGSLFKCSCGNQQHSDLNASRTICRFALPIGFATCAVNRTHVAASR